MSRQSTQEMHTVIRKSTSAGGSEHECYGGHYPWVNRRPLSTCKYGVQGHGVHGLKVSVDRREGSGCVARVCSSSVEEAAGRIELILIFSGFCISLQIYCLMVS